MLSKGVGGRKKSGSLWGEGWGVALYPTSHLFMSWAVVDEIVGMQFCKIIASKGRGEREKRGSLNIGCDFHYLIFS